MDEKNPFAVERRETAEVSLVATDHERAIAEVQAALVIAQRFPRDQKAAMDRILTACARPSLAEVALYQYARGGQDITGPSIRMAEAIAQQWGNMQFGVRELGQRNAESIVETFAWDVETNTRVTKVFTVPHMRSTKRGKVALEDPRDIYEAVANQGSRRMRACILAVIPGDVIAAAVEQVEQTLATHADISPETVAKMLAWFAGVGVTRAQVEARIQRRIESVTSAQMVQLAKIRNSIRDGMSKPVDWFESDLQAPPAPSTTAKPEPVAAGETPITAEVSLLAAIDAAEDEAALGRLTPRLAKAKTPALVAAYRARQQALSAPSGKPWPEQAPESERYPDPEPEEPAETHYVPDAPDPSRYQIPGGRSKGTPLPEASDRDLEYWGGRIGGDLEAGKTEERYRERDEDLLAAIREEQRRRAEGEQPEPPAEEWPTTDEIPF